MVDRPLSLTAQAFLYAAALLWLPAGVVLSAVVRFGPSSLAAIAGAAWLSLVAAALCGLPLAFACRRLGRLGHIRAAWIAGGVLGAATVAAALPAGLFGPPGLLAAALLLSLPAWIAAFWLGRRARPGTRAGKAPLDGPDRRP